MLSQPQVRPTRRDNGAPWVEEESDSVFSSPLQDSLELVFKQSKAVAVTSMAFPLGDVNNFVVGSEDGSVYTACRHGR